MIPNQCWKMALNQTNTQGTTTAYWNPILWYYYILKSDIQIRFSGPTAYEPSTFSLPEDEGVDGVETGSVAPYLRSEWTPVPVNSHLADTTPHDQPLADLSLTDKEAKKKRWDFPTFKWKLLDLIISCLFVTSSSLTRRQKRNGKIFLLNPPNQYKTWNSMKQRFNAA